MKTALTVFVTIVNAMLGYAGKLALSPSPLRWYHHVYAAWMAVVTGVGAYVLTRVGETEATEEDEQ